MKRYFLPLLATLSMLSCQENIEDKALRETREYTRKNCPMKIADNVMLDSMAFEPGSRTICYYYSMLGASDTTAIDKSAAREMLVKGIIESTSVRKYKENNFSFSYTYFSTKHKGTLLLKVVVKPEDYNK
ncbi:MAG: hypothetical protein ACI4V5_00170 [Prevotella sp.]